MPSFAWDASTGEGTIYYRVYHSLTSGVYVDTDREDAGTATSYTWQGNLGSAGPHYFIVRAYNAAGESANSNEVNGEFNYFACAMEAA